MNGLMKKLAVALAIATAFCGGGFAQNFEGRIQSDSAFIVEDTMRDILTTLHSRLDAFRKVQLPVASAPAPETVTNVVAPAAYGSLVAQTPADCAVPLPEYDCGERYLNRIWGGGIGTWQRADERGDSPGYDFDGQGVMIGIDRAAGAATFGMAVSYVKGKYENKFVDDHDSDIMQYSGHVYATYNNSRGFFFSVAGGYTFSDNEIDEWRGAREPYLTADYKAHTFTGSVRMGFDFEPSDSVVITPSIGGSYFHSKTRDHMENRKITGTQQYVEYANIKHNQVEIPFDITIAKEFYFGGNRMLQLSVNGGYAYNLNDKALAGDYAVDGGAFARIDARRLGHHAWKGGAALRLKMDQWDIGAKYDYLARNDYKSHRVLGTVGYNF